jgi:exosortase
MATSATTNISEETKPIEKVITEQAILLKALLPYLLAIGMQLPMVILYYRSLWHKVHYTWFPFAFLVTAAFIWTRWPKANRQPFIESTFSNVLLVAGLLAGLMGVWFLEPWFAAMSAILLVTSLLARTMDSDTGHSMWTAALPLYVTLTLPFNGDMQLITWLQRVAAQLTSRLLDLIGIGHYLPGTVIQMPGKEYGIEQMCSGVQSFFTLLFVAVAFVVWMRRPWFRSLLLIAAAVFWAIFMNTISILLIPIFDVYFEWDFSTGVQHAILGYCTLALGIFLLLSTDQFLMFMFGPVESSSGHAGPFGRFFTRVWNNLLAGEDDDEDIKKRKRRREPLTTVSRIFAWAVAVPLILASAYVLIDVFKSYSAPGKQRISFFNTNVIYPFTETDLPERYDDWELLKYEPETRSRSSDLGLRSDGWQYQSKQPAYRCHISFDQTFPGWHELTRCYLNGGWKFEQSDRVRRDEATGNEDERWSFIQVELEKDTGEKGFLLFCMFDAFGEPYAAPAEWGTVTSIITRAKSRLNHRIRASLWQSEAYQFQLFISDYQEIPQIVKDDATVHFLKIREIVRQKFLEKKTGEVSAANLPTSATDTTDAPVAEEKSTQDGVADENAN